MKPILFNTEMVKAILDNSKTVTRRVIKFSPADDYTFLELQTDPYEIRAKPSGEEYPHQLSGLYATFADTDGCYPMAKTPYQIGDILYVRETWGDYSECESGGVGYYLYRADYPDGAKTYMFDEEHICDLPRWRPSIHMPKEAARIFLRVTDVRVERLQDITEEQAIAEGCEGVRCNHDFADYISGVFTCTDCMGTGWLEPPIVDFVDNWNGTIKKKDLDKYGWEVSPWVWVIEFERFSKEGESKSDNESKS